MEPATHQISPPLPPHSPTLIPPSSLSLENEEQERKKERKKEGNGEEIKAKLSWRRR